MCSRARALVVHLVALRGPAGSEFGFLTLMLFRCGFAPDMVVPPELQRRLVEGCLLDGPLGRLHIDPNSAPDRTRIDPKSMATPRTTLTIDPKATPQIDLGSTPDLFCSAPAVKVRFRARMSSASNVQWRHLSLCEGLDEEARLTQAHAHPHAHARTLAHDARSCIAFAPAHAHARPDTCA